jgi:membrane peptidoglycan carboxypeptidase
MEGQGLITSRETSAAKNAEIRFQEAVPVHDPLALEFIHFVREDLSSYIPIERVKRGGYQVITTLDYDLQVQAACATEAHLTRISQPGTQSPQDVEVQPASGTEDCQASKLLSTLALEDGNTLQDAAANVAVYDPQTGQLLALVEHPAGTGENAINAGQPPGSLFTPFVYLTAFTRGFNPASLVWEIPIELADIPVEATNPDGEYEGPMRLRNAMATDTLIPAIQIIRQIGAENVLKIASQSGFNTLSLDTSTGAAKECPGCQLILDGGEITLLEAVQAFGVFANQGTLVGQPSDESTRNDLRRLRPITVLSVQDYENKAWTPETAIETRPVISTQLAYLMTNILSDEAARWPRYNHPNPLEIGRPAGAKMGLSSTGKDVWTVGYTPQLVVGVWMGLPEEEGEIRLPPKTASGLWHAVLQYAVQDQVAETWSMPPGVTEMDVCDPSGMLPTLQCPTIIREVFLTGQEPTQPDTLYQTYQVNRETNRLATVFTPPELIEERTYLNVPPEAMDWAVRIGMETPPETYDLINAPDMDPDALIENPQMFDYLKGVVDVQGRVGGSDFESYRLQGGEGLNPSGWIVIQQDTFRPVEDGKLGTWVTSGLDGLYALQLIVLREDQRVDTTTIQVTLDNTPPEVSITYPNNLDTLSGTSEKTITFLVDAVDNLGLEAVEYYLDGRLISTQNRPPFAYAWSSRTGRFTLTVKASDHAGNTGQAEMTFTVE